MECTDFKYDNGFSKFLPKTPKEDILIQNLIFHETKSLDKLEGVDYEYDISFLTF